MKIIFESQLYPEPLIDEFINNSKSSLDFAAHNFSKAIYNGLLQNSQIVELLNTPNLGSFPFLFKKPWVRGCELDNGKSIGYCNISLIKRNSIKAAMQKRLCQLFESSKGEEQIVLLLYNFRCVQFLKELKQDYPGIKICMIITDLPEYMVNPYGSVISGWLSRLFGYGNISSKLDLQEVDGFVLLAPKMAEKLSIEGKPWIQMEGIYESGTDVKCAKKETENVILYTGNLSKRYGIINLLDAFDRIKDENYRLWLRGSGDCEEEIINRARVDKRISLIPALSREELLKLQKKATILINPVSSKEEFTNYFFPSKTLEYLASGTPVLMAHLGCLPSDYNDYIYFFDDETEEGMKEKIIEICSKPKEERASFANAASIFIEKYKTPKPQMAKVIEFINSII